MALPQRVSLIAAVLTLLLSFSALYAQENYVDIADFADENGCELRLDYWKGMYELRKGGSIARLMEGSSYYLLNFIELRSGLQAVVTDEGHFLIDKKSAGILQEFFEQTAASHRGITYIVLDPGHGGKDPGAIGYFTVDNEKKTLREKDVVLSTVLETARLLRLRFPEKTVLLTRSDDRYLKLEERTEIANSINLADDESMIFISVHANASFNSTAKGFEVWYLPPEFRRDLVDPDRMEDVDSDVIPILNTMLEEEFTIESVILGEHLLKSLDLQVGDITENRGPKEESWFVVRNARMPSVLIELGFVTNPEEAALLSTDAYLKKLSNGIYNGIVEFISDYERSRGYSD